MPFSTTRVIHPDWSDHNSRVNDDPSSVNCKIKIFDGDASTGGWNPTDGPVAGTAALLYGDPDGAPARVSFDLDRPFTKDNADQVTSTSIVLVQLPKTAQVKVFPGNTIQVVSVDKNGLEALADMTLRVLSQRRSGVSWGPTFDCVEMTGRASG